MGWPSGRSLRVAPSPILYASPHFPASSIPGGPGTIVATCGGGDLSSWVSVRVRIAAKRMGGRLDDLFPARHAGPYRRTTEQAQDSRIRGTFSVPTSAIDFSHAVLAADEREIPTRRGKAGQGGARCGERVRVYVARVRGEA